MARAQGDEQAARRLLVAAAGAFERLGQRLDGVRCRQDLDAIHAAAGGAAGAGAGGGAGKV
jgi:hypothetical protein